MWDRQPGRPLIRSAYELLGLETYFTAGEKEVRAWTIHKGTSTASSRVIHTDFERGFIRAEVTARRHDGAQVRGSNQRRSLKGRKEYVVEDGDIMHFRFNV